MRPLSIVNLFCRDIGFVGDFFPTTFALDDLPGRTATFRPLGAGSIMLALSDWSVYEVLGLNAPRHASGDGALVTFDATSREGLDELTDIACRNGAQLVLAPFETSYGWYQSVLRDPEGHAIRLSFAG